MENNNTNPLALLKESLSFLANSNHIIAVNFLLNITHDVIMLFLIRSIPIIILVYSNIISNHKDLVEIYNISIDCAKILVIIVTLQFFCNMKDSYIINILNDSISVFKDDLVKKINIPYNLREFTSTYKWTIIITTIIIFEIVIAYKIIEYITINIILESYYIDYKTSQYIINNGNTLIYYASIIGITISTTIFTIINTIYNAFFNSKKNR